MVGCPSEMARSNLLLRVLTAAVLIPLVLVLVLWAPQQVFAGAVAAVALFALYEYLGIARSSRLDPLPWYPYIAVGVMVLWPLGSGSAITLFVLAALTLIMRPNRTLEAALPGAASTVFGILYLGLPMAMLVQLRALPRGPEWVIYVLVLVWISDTAAYFTGRALGRHKLAPRISPGKTWEGSAGSLVAAVLFGVIYAGYIAPGLSWGWSLAMAAAVNVAGQIGDLAESALKRGAGVKDSSTLLPGHGGVLDRIDALLFAVPALWYILSLRTGWFFAPLP